MFMGNHQNCSTDIVDALEQFYDLVGQFRVDVAGRLVRNDKLRIVYQRTGNRHTLLFAAGKLVRISVRLILQAHQTNYIRYTLSDILRRRINYTQHECYVFVYGHGRDQPEVLEHKPDGTPQRRDTPPPQFIQIIPINIDRTAGRIDLFQDQLDHGTFTGTGSANHKGKVSVIDFQVDIVQCVYAAGICHRDILQFNHSSHTSFLLVLTDKLVRHFRFRVRRTRRQALS